MRIAYKNIKVLVGLTVTFFLIEGSTKVWAADIPPPPSPAGLEKASTTPSTAVMVASATPDPNLASPPAEAKSSNASSVPVMPIAAKTDNNGPPSQAIAPINKTPSTGEGLKAAEDKIPESVKDAMKRLDKPTDDVTLDDLNSARQAIAKIEILIELEKHLAELDKYKHDRQKDTGVAAMIPASALQAPYVPQQAEIHQAVPVIPKEPLEVTRVMGGGGRYSAVIKMSGDESKTVHVGDHMPDGSDVTAISPTEVVLEHEGVKHTLHVKNIDTVFGNSF